jgi:hypothetical protein
LAAVAVQRWLQLFPLPQSQRPSAPLPPPQHRRSAIAPRR